MMLRPATVADAPVLSDLIARSARVLCRKDYAPDVIEAALRGAFGVDSQLIADRTYLVVEDAGAPIGCGGWSYRRTLFGGDAGAGRDAGLLDPARDAAKIRAFFIDPDHAGRGVGEALLSACEAAAAKAGFARFELMATLTGARFYARHGYIGDRRETIRLDAQTVIDFIPMQKSA